MSAACPICRKPQDANYKPFCSKRCADVDLHRWLSDGYAIEGGAESGEDEPPSEEDERE